MSPLSVPPRLGLVTLYCIPFLAFHLCCVTSWPLFPLTLGPSPEQDWAPQHQ